jgi:WD40 repeat protein
VEGNVLIKKNSHAILAVMMLLLLVIQGCAPQPNPTPNATDASSLIQETQPTPTSLAITDTPVNTEQASPGRENINSGINVAAFSPDGQWLAVATPTGIFLYDPNSREELDHIDTTSVNSVAFSPDGTLLASGCGDGTIKLWRVEDFTLLWTQTGYPSPVDSVAFSPDGMSLATGSRDPVVKVWNVLDGSLMHELEGHTDTISSVVFSPDGTRLASGSQDGTIKLWRITDGGLSRTLDWSYYSLGPVSEYGNHIKSVAFSPDGTYFAAGSFEDNVKIWRVSDWYLIQTLRATEMDHADPSNSASMAAYFAQDSLPARSIAFSPDGALLATAGYQTITLWKLADYSVQQSFHSWTIDYVDCVVFSLDGTRLVSISSQVNNISVWDVASGTSLEIP